MTYLRAPIQFDASGRTATADRDTYVRGLIEQVLLTSPGERVRRPTFGAGLLHAVFAPGGDDLAAAAQDLVQASLHEWLGDIIDVEGVEVVSDDATVRVLAEDADIVAWLYGDKASPAGKVVLDRDWGVNIENPVFVPNLEKFTAGYAATSARRRYYVIQGHPSQWDEARFADFVGIIDFLAAHDARFVTPLELARVLNS
jgi:hypothetical protein